MNLIFGSVLGVLGLTLGFFIQTMSEWLIRRKGRARENEVQENFSSHLLFYLSLMMVNGVIWAGAGTFMTHQPAAVLVGILVTTSLLIAVIDVRVHLIPNELVIFMLVVGLLFQLLYFDIRAALISLVCMLAMMALFLLTGVLVGMDKVGAGDVKLAGAIGAALGYPLILTGVMTMCVAFVLFSLTGLLIKKLTLFTMLPFAPFMMLGMIIPLLGIIIKG